MVGHLTCPLIGNGYLLAREVDKDLFSGPIFLPKSVVQFLGLMAIEIAELTVLIAIGMLFFVLKP